VRRAAFEIYAYAAPAILAPLTFWLWWHRYDGALGPTLTAWLVPVLYAYIVPAVGTNVLRVWEFDTRVRIGRFRPQHGFVFGSATAALAWLCHGEPATDWTGVARTSAWLGVVLGSVNVIYDVKLLESGVLRVYNQPWAEGRGSAEIVLDYAPWFFGAFGAVYGAALGTAELLATQGRLTGAAVPGFVALALAVAIAVPVAGYWLQSLRRHGHSGCRPVARIEP